MKDKGWLERYIFLLFGLYWLGKQLQRVFFTDFVGVTWFDYVGWYGITFLIMLFAFIFWDKILLSFEKKNDQ
jgi:hypothetical protein